MPTLCHGIPSRHLLPTRIARYLRETEEMLIDAGFRCIGGFVLPNSTPNAKAVLRAYVHDENRDTAMVNVVFAMVAGRPTVRASFAEFESEFTTGNVRSIETNNNSVLSPFPVLFDRRKARFPYIRDLGYLYQLHQVLVMQHVPGERKALRLVEESPDDASAFIREVVVRETLRRQETTGYLRVQCGAEVLACNDPGGLSDDLETALAHQLASSDQRATHGPPA